MALFASSMCIDRYYPLTLHPPFIIHRLILCILTSSVIIISLLGKKNFIICPWHYRQSQAELRNMHTEQIPRRHVEPYNCTEKKNHKEDKREKQMIPPFLPPGNRCRDRTLKEREVKCEEASLNKRHLSIEKVAKKHDWTIIL